MPPMVQRPQQGGPAQPQRNPQMPQRPPQRRPQGAGGPTPSGPGQILQKMQKNLRNMNPEQLKQLEQYFTPETVGLMGALLGKEVAQQLAPFANSDTTLIPMPKRAAQYLGEEKINKFIEKAMQDSAEAQQAGPQQQQPQQGAGGGQQGMVQKPETPSQSPMQGQPGGQMTSGSGGPATQRPQQAQPNRMESRSFA